ncbi:bifunctional glycosyltransferase family 2 protein/CDP-glycerol:glycerophosphate glycerophosphotransferase [Sporosarcina sp. Marseille-Q4063]|uniref:bifunctional glycosyltransferase/CDP-glycerol:glycerophosphate glycerophosphotransferase n=1 Tax=Sporosarcina sp. Marseille-Q4063 TaxID=2810514 RepID=UPI001BB0A59A|nr:bifunctional glycosyltransferase family 2 protein/CDP-glycerol:glycerophosphate glycerophosphotransferase [Sporosarcina sp. Marseille-Q4063]QUW21219.1 bifunctional glycosyltransferase family 2 protein/CDP-glycerol:glycerophosphate glycerophosphotransferase [Sporosarcina sp. Marseille-Q4063]
MVNVNNTQLNQKPPKLSVIVIAYNNEIYIEEALESLDAQTFDDMEVVVVNDFSSDSTGELINRFVEGKPKFKAIHLPENSGGCSTPRNTGIANTTGEYVMFLDGDDWYTIDACEKMVAGMERTQSDFVAGQVIRTNNYEIWYHRQIYSREHTNINIREFSMLLFDSLSVNKIYKRSFLDKHKLRFPEGIHYEDIYFTGQAYFLAESVSIIPEPIYYWRVVEDADVKSITNRRFDFDNFKNRIIAHRLFDQFLQDNGDILYQTHKNNKFLRHDLKLYTNDYLLFDEDYKNRFHKMTFDYLRETMDEYEFIRLPENERIMYYLLFIGDREAFDDYVFYKNNLPTKSNRIYNVGSSYYFRSSISNDKNEKFLGITQPEINYNINDINLEKNNLTFHADVQVGSIDNSEITSFWVLRNRQTGATIHNEHSDNGNVNFNLNQMEPGNYYLSLFVRHMGNLHKSLVKNSNVSELSNVEVKDQKLSKSIFINQNNSFAIKVRPIQKLEQFKWMYNKRKSAKPIRRPGIIQTKLTSYTRKIIKKLPVRSKWILFESNMGKQYSDNPKYIYKMMSETQNDYKYIWSFEDPKAIKLPRPAVKVKRNSLKHFYYLNRSKYWVDNQGMAHLTEKKEQQIYLQTWHGTPLKKMGYDQKKLPSKAELDRLKIQTKAWDYFVSPNAYSTNIFKKAFRYGGEIIESGYPRNDILINQRREVIQKVQDRFEIGSEKKVILFAPTFRDWDPDSFQKVIKDMQAISQEIDDNSIVLLRLHYLLSNKISQADLPSNVINVSTYNDIQELYLLADVLITDYSSIMFDYALLKRPIILYCYDLEEYVTRRGMYFDLIEKAPGPICRTIDDVLYYLNHQENDEIFDEHLERFINEFGSLEIGRSASRVIEQVFK